MSNFRFFLSVCVVPLIHSTVFAQAGDWMVVKSSTNINGPTEIIKSEMTEDAARKLARELQSKSKLSDPFFYQALQGTDRLNPVPIDEGTFGGNRKTPNLNDETQKKSPPANKDIVDKASDRKEEEQNAIEGKTVKIDVDGDEKVYGFDPNNSLTVDGEKEAGDWQQLGTGVVFRTPENGYRANINKDGKINGVRFPKDGGVITWKSEIESPTSEKTLAGTWCEDIREDGLHNRYFVIDKNLTFTEVRHYGQVGTTREAMRKFPQSTTKMYGTVNLSGDGVYVELKDKGGYHERWGFKFVGTWDGQDQIVGKVINHKGQSEKKVFKRYIEKSEQTDASDNPKARYFYYGYQKIYNGFQDKVGRTVITGGQTSDKEIAIKRADSLDSRGIKDVVVTEHYDVISRPDWQFPDFVKGNPNGKVIYRP